MIVDIHNHILYGLDDGPQNQEETILLAKQAVESGIHHVIATPHHKHRHKDQFYENHYSKILHLVDEVNGLLLNHQIPITVYPGIEFHLHEHIRKDFDEHPEQFLTLNNTGKYLLMELPCSYYPTHTESFLYTLQERGFVPILAHPERNKILRRNPGKIYEMVQRGILVQVTAGSIAGRHGRRLKNFSIHLLDHHLVHFIASDAHHYSRRKFELTSAYDWVEQNYSKKYRNYLEANSIHALNGTDFDINEPKFIVRKIQYFFLRETNRRLSNQ